MFKEESGMERDSQVWNGALWEEVQRVDCGVLTAGGISPRRLVHAQVVLRSTLPINPYFTNAIFTVWLPDNIPYVKKTDCFKTKVRTYCKKVERGDCYMNTSMRLY